MPVAIQRLKPGSGVLEADPTLLRKAGADTRPRVAHENLQSVFCFARPDHHIPLPAPGGNSMFDRILHQRLEQHGRHQCIRCGLIEIERDREPVSEADPLYVQVFAEKI